LSHFVKFLFKEELLEDRNKVAEFAKIDFQRLKQNEKAQNDGTTTITRTETDSEGPMQVKGPVKPPDNLILQSSSKDIAFHVDPNKLRQQLAKTKSRIALHNQAQNDEVSRLYSNKKRGALATWGTPALLAAVFLSFGYIMFKNPNGFFRWGSSIVGRIFPQTVKEASVNPNSEGNASAPSDIGTADLGNQNAAAPTIPEPPREISHLTIRSFPAGAEVQVIDDETKETRTLGRTPLDVNLPSRRKVKFILSKTGYKLIREYIPMRPIEDVALTLEKVLYGCVNIEVKPEGSDIFVDDIKVDPTLARRHFAIPANKPVKIHAVNHYTGFRDEQTVVVKQDTVRTINLFPRQKR
jgi:hypothetical protein